MSEVDFTETEQDLQQVQRLHPFWQFFADQTVLPPSQSSIVDFLQQFIYITYFLVY